jgi:Domain of unknown function (DUF4129)
MPRPGVPPTLVISQNPALSDDSLRAVIDTVLSASPYQWTDTAPRLSWLGRWWRALVDWLARLQENNPLAADILFWSLASVLIVIFLHGGWIVYQTMKRATVVGGGAGGATAVALRDERWYQRLADRLAAEGRYAEAMQAAFRGLMLRLDARGLVRYHPSKTPREYAREARLNDRDRQDLADSVGRLYAHAYAGQPCESRQYHDWLASLRRDWHAAQS